MPKENKKIIFSHSGIILEHFPGYFLLAALVISFIYLYKLFLPFLTILTLAAILAIAFYPIYEKVLFVFKKKQKTASFISVLLVLFLIVVPVLVFLLLLGKQAYDIVHYTQQQINSGAMDWVIKWEPGGWIYDSLGELRDQFKGFIVIDSMDIKQNLLDAVRPVTSFLASQSASILKGFGSLLLGFFIFLFALYYFFKDHEAIVKKMMVLSPLPNEHEKHLVEKFKEISLATLYGIFFTAIVQGIVAGVGFVIAGVPNAVFWGTAVAIFSLVPMIGTSIIWLPAAIILLASGHIWNGVFIFFWGMLIVSTVDNFLRAYLIGGRTNTNQLLTFLAVFGGLLMFGLPGVIIGPLILNLFLTLLHIYEIEYSGVLHRKG